MESGTRPTASRHNAGFTLIELMIVVSIVGILASIAVPNYQWSVIRSKEAVLRENLYSLRSVIDQFYADSGKYPDALADIVSRGYMRDMPKDPFTGKNDTWVTLPPVAPAAANTTGGSTTTTAPQGNVYDVKSGSNLVGSNGVAYNEW